MYTSTRTNVVLVCKYVPKVVETIFQAINALEVENNRSLKQTLTVMNDEFLKGKIQDQLKNRAIETFGTLKECHDFRMLNSLIKLSLKV